MQVFQLLDGEMIKVMDVVSPLKEVDPGFKQFLDRKVSSYIKKHKTVFKIPFFFEFGRIFNFENLKKITKHQFQRYFSRIVDENINQFKELEFTSVATILESSQLEATSEIQVYQSSLMWISYKNRSQFSKKILKKIRLRLLAIEDLNDILKNSEFCKVKECVEIVEMAIKWKDNPSSTKYFSNLPVQRYCPLWLFILGGECKSSGQILSKVIQIDPDNFKSVKALPSFSEERRKPKVVVLDREIYVFDGFDGTAESIEKYNSTLNCWRTVADMYDDRDSFCVSVLDNSNMLIIGGVDVMMNELDSCLTFNVKNLTWKQVSSTNEKRFLSASAFYRGNAVVSGGFDGKHNKCLASAEYFNYNSNSWTALANMNEGKYYHSLVAVKKKLFALGSYGRDKFEVYDHASKQFTIFKAPPIPHFDSVSQSLNLSNFVLFGNKLVSFTEKSTNVYSYDISTDEWTVEYCEKTKDILHFTVLSLKGD